MTLKEEEMAHGQSSFSTSEHRACKHVAYSKQTSFKNISETQAGDSHLLALEAHLPHANSSSVLIGPLVQTMSTEPVRARLKAGQLQLCFQTPQAAWKSPEGGGGGLGILKKSLCKPWPMRGRRCLLSGKSPPSWDPVFPPQEARGIRSS